MEIVSNETLLLFLAALAISFFTSTGGVSGAFLLLPFQSFYFGYTVPSISATNHVYNILATLGGIYRYNREGRMLWSLVVPLAAGSVPGVAVGAWIRVRFLPDSQNFKLFAGLLLLAIALRMVWDLRTTGNTPVGIEKTSLILSNSWADWKIGLVSFLVGILGGIYGIGGGVLLAPILVSFFRLSVRMTAGATLVCTWIASLVGAFSFQMIAAIDTQQSIAPDWRAGVLMGLGGLLGTYAGARFQKHLSVAFIKAILALSLFVVAFLYISGYSGSD